MPELAKHFQAPQSRLFFLDRTPGHGISQHVARQPHVIHLPFNGRNLEETITLGALANYTFDDAQRPASEADGRQQPIVVFMSTYYNHPELSGICNVLMYHDLIPERVGMYAGPGMT
jgi:hypothetical protein